MSKRKYTREIHIKRLRGMLKRKEPCLCCPKMRRYTWTGLISWTERGVGEYLWDNEYEACAICLEFLGLSSWNTDCPCNELGKEEALKQTIIALEKEDYQNEPRTMG